MTRFIHHQLRRLTVLGLAVMFAQPARAQEIGRDLSHALSIGATLFATTLPRISGSLLGSANGVSTADESAPARKVVDKRFAGLGVALLGAVIAATRRETRRRG
jgi:MYXO-CTERM domain-containing protein